MSSSLARSPHRLNHVDVARWHIGYCGEGRLAGLISAVVLSCSRRPAKQHRPSADVLLRSSTFVPRESMLYRGICCRFRCVCPSVPVRSSVCLSQAGTVPKRLNVRPSEERHVIAQVVSVAKNLDETRTALSTTLAPNEGGVGYNRRFSTDVSLYLRNRYTVTMEG